MIIEAFTAYIQFAIDNGYKFNGYIVLEKYIFEFIHISWIFHIKIYAPKKEHIIPLLEIIMSKEFIEAIARGKNMTTNEITTKQAIAIRDKHLVQFINNLGIGEKKI